MAPEDRAMMLTTDGKLCSGTPCIRDHLTCFLQLLKAGGRDVMVPAQSFAVVSSDNKPWINRPYLM